MTVGDLIEKLSEFPKGVNIRFVDDTHEKLKTILKTEDIIFYADMSPDEPLHVDILLKEVGLLFVPLREYKSLEDWKMDGTVKQFKDILDEMKGIYKFEDENTVMSTWEFQSRRNDRLTIRTIDKDTGVDIVMSKGIKEAEKWL